MTNHSETSIASQTAFEASPDDIVRASELVRVEADRLRKVVLGLPASGFQRCSDDPVSVAAAAAFNEKSRALVESFRSHVDELDQQAELLASASQHYRTADHGIRDTFGVP